MYKKKAAAPLQLVAATLVAYALLSKEESLNIHGSSFKFEVSSFIEGFLKLRYLPEFRAFGSAGMWMHIFSIFRKLL